MNGNSKLTMIVLLACTACSGGERNGDAAPGDTLTRAQRDSVIGASKLPGARGVQRALDTRDSANARNAAMDSLLRQ